MKTKTSHTQVNRTAWLSLSYRSSTTRRCRRLLMTSLKHVTSIQINITSSL